MLEQDLQRKIDAVRGKISALASRVKEFGDAAAALQVVMGMSACCVVRDARRLFSERAAPVDHAASVVRHTLMTSR